MGLKTEISWCDSTWSPVRGCTRVSEGCRHCYSERMAARGLPGLRSPTTGCDFASNTISGPRWSGRVELIESQLEIPLHWKKPRRIFVNSVSDTFHEALPDEAIDRIFAVMALCRQHTFMVLTKRAKRMREYLSDLSYRTEVVGIEAEHRSGWDRYMRGSDETTGSGDDMLPRWPLPLSNVWLGVSVEDQATGDARIPLLLQTSAAVRFISAEPLLSAIDFSRYMSDNLQDSAWGSETEAGGRDGGLLQPQKQSRQRTESAGSISLILLGGESGPGARRCRVEWIRSVVEQCREAGCACFVKQLGAHVGGDWPEFPGYDPEINGYPIRHRKGGDPEEWPSDLRVRQMPEVNRAH
jgi:protein gp37